MCIGAAKGKYIARMDADDIALPERLQVQYDFMEQHKEYAWCGCNTRLFDENGVWGERKCRNFRPIKTICRFLPSYIRRSCTAENYLKKRRLSCFPGNIAL